MSDRINDGALVEALATFVGQHFPFAFCYTCLAKRLATSEPALRAATKRLLTQHGWSMGRRFCHGCATQDLVIERREPMLIVPAYAPALRDERCIV